VGAYAQCFHELLATDTKADQGLDVEANAGITAAGNTDGQRDQFFFECRQSAGCRVPSALGTSLVMVAKDLLMIIPLVIKLENSNIT